jgi:sensor histidine kinase regulating citrate/malate metabolism
LKEYEEATLYLNKIYGKINQLNNNIRTDKIAVNALLQTKSHEAEQKNINFVVDASSNLSSIQIEEWDLCACLSNLIDNAFEATLKHDGMRYVWMKINEDMEKYTLEVSNTGKSLTKVELEHIFLEGVSSKKENGHGLGLYLVKNALKDKGVIQVTSAEFGMIFTICLLKQPVK